MDAIVEAFHYFRDQLYLLLKFYQQLVEPLLGSQSYWFAIVLLTVSVRLVLIPLYVKQVRASRAMSELAPELKKLQAKYKDNREKLNQEMMALYRERGANPAAGCLPILAQAPVFFALYHVIFKDELAGEKNILRGEGFFGVPLETHWWTLSWADKFLSLDGLVILLLIVLMVGTTWFSQKQLLARQTEMTPQQQMMIRFMPMLFAVFAVGFPLAVIIYWVTTNLWTMGQQYIMLRNQPAKGDASGATSSKDRAQGSQGTAKSKATTAKVRRDATTTQDAAKPDGGSGRARRGLLPNLRAGFTDAFASRENGGSARSNQPEGAGSSSNGNPPRSKQPGGQTSESTGRPRPRKGKPAGRKPASRAGGGKSGGRGQQRRRKR